MFDWFDLPVLHNGKDLLFQARLIQAGYIHKFVVMVDNEEILFEPDEERNYRAVATSESIPKTISVSLLFSIADAIKTVFT